MPTVSAEQLRLDDALAKVPEGGIAVDLGAGVRLVLAAAMYARRPDLHIISVDPGFEYLDEYDDLFSSDIDDVIATFGYEQQTTLRDANAWRETLLPTLAEETSLENASVDLIASYAAVPLYSPDRKLALTEILRILKVGGLAINGPLENGDFEEWDSVIRNALAAGAITSYSHWTVPVQTTFGGVVDAYFTRISK